LKTGSGTPLGFAVTAGSRAATDAGSGRMARRELEAGKACGTLLRWGRRHTLRGFLLIFGPVSVPSAHGP
jgi:hypothetical protein